MRVVFLAFLSAIVSSTSLAGKTTRTFKLVTFENTNALPAYQETTAFIESVLKKSSLNVTTLQMPVLRGLQVVDTGQADFLVAGTASLTRKYKNLRSLSFPYLKSQLFVIYHKDSVKFKSNTPLRKMHGIVLLNSPEVFIDTAEMDLNLLGVSSTVTGLRMILSKRADFLLANEAVIQSIRKRDPERYQKFILQRESKYEQRLYLILHKKNELLLPILEKNLKESLTPENAAGYPNIKSLLNLNP